MRTQALKKRPFENYVLGLLFGPRYGGTDEVLLIRKKRPQWMRGKLNGIGGHVEEDESSVTAMAREMKEETGLVWTPNPMVFAILEFPRAKRRVTCYTSNRKYIRSASTMSDKVVDRYGYPQCLQRKDLADHLRWLMPLAIEFNQRNVDAVTFRMT